LGYDPYYIEDFRPLDFTIPASTTSHQSPLEPGIRRACYKGHDLVIAGRFRGNYPYGKCLQGRGKILQLYKEAYGLPELNRRTGNPKNSGLQAAASISNPIPSASRYKVAGGDKSNYCQPCSAHTTL